MKVCYFTHESNVTGANRSLLDMLEGLKGLDVEPVVILRRNGPLRQELKNSGISYKIIPYNSTLKSDDPAKDAAKKVRNQFALKKICRYLKDNGIELLHNNDMMCRLGAEAAYMTGIPYICHLRDMVNEDHRRMFMDEAREKEILEHAAAVICISQYVYEKFSPWMPNQKNVKIIYNGINASNYLIKEKKIMTEDAVHISIVGRISENKRQLDAVKAMDILQNERGYQNLYLRIIGRLSLKRDRKYVRAIRDYIGEHHLSTVAVFPFARQVIEKQRGVDIGLMCSDHEAMGRATIESMLAGNLTIGARAGATPELIEDGENGLLYESRNVQSLADTIEQALKDPGRSREIAARGQEYAVRKFDIHKYAETIFGYYSAILAEKADNGSSDPEAGAKI